MSDSSDSDNEYENHHFVFPPEMRQRGLVLLGYTTTQIDRAQDDTNKKRFKSTFGASAATLCTIYEDLQSTNLIFGEDNTLKWFLISFYFLKKYPTEKDREYIFKVSEKYSRTMIWKMVENIRALKEIKITWPDDLASDDIWIMSVDGTHCWIAEPGHPEFSQDSSYYSHKFNKAGINYELGIALASQKLIWMNGPFKAGMNDVSIFRNEGLKDRLSVLQKKAIGDAGYNGHQEQCVTPNPNDSVRVKKFKSRALKRHETFNGMTKAFDALSGRFRHSRDKFPIVFEAICVICQYKIELEEPLFDILIEELVE